MSSRNPSSQKSLISLPFLTALIVFGLLLYKNGANWLRTVLIYLSHAPWARRLVTELTLAKRVSGRFVAGETIDEAIVSARALNSRGMSVTIDYLGESVTDEVLARASAGEIRQLLDNIQASGVDANVSVKLSQLGLRIRRDLALENVRSIMKHALRYDNKIRIDMEESDLVDVTFEIYRTLRDEDGYQNVGVVIQSYLYRSERDVARLVDEGAWVRLCKGAYAEPPDVAFPNKADTDQNFITLTHSMLRETAIRNGLHLGVATHDEKMIDATIDYVKLNGISAKDFEFQMLFGIRRELQQKLVQQGYNVRIYVPYGTAWYPYLVRRLAEHPANMWFFVSNLFRN